jgi:hypothetical protein
MENHENHCITFIEKATRCAKGTRIAYHLSFSIHFTNRSYTKSLPHPLYKKAGTPDRRFPARREVSHFKFVFVLFLESGDGSQLFDSTFLN